MQIPVQEEEKKNLQQDVFRDTAPFIPGLKASRRHPPDNPPL